MKLCVIEPVNEPTEWVSSIVLVKKTNGKLRFCLDPRNLNKSIMRSHYQFPTIHDIKSKLAGSKIFSTLDANSGFWTVPLDQECVLTVHFHNSFWEIQIFKASIRYQLCSRNFPFHNDDTFWGHSKRNYLY